MCLSRRSDGDPQCMNLQQTHTHTEDYHMGSRALGGETRRVLTLLFLWPFFLAASEETTEERKRRGGVGVLKDDCRGRRGVVRLSG